MASKGRTPDGPTSSRDGSALRGLMSAIWCRCPGWSQSRSQALLQRESMPILPVPRGRYRFFQNAIRSRPASPRKLQSRSIVSRERSSSVLLRVNSGNVEMVRHIRCNSSATGGPQGPGQAGQPTSRAVPASTPGAAFSCAPGDGRVQAAPLSPLLRWIVRRLAIGENRSG